jgi:hypothetical protein
VPNTTKSKPKARVFKTAWFNKAAMKAKISDAALCAALAEVLEGKADDLGGGVYKKRLNNNLHRAVILPHIGQHWIYAFVFAKNKRANIDDAELTAFRTLAKHYAALNPLQLRDLLAQHELLEICHDC